MMRIAIANQKGGVGKTTTAMTLAHGCARSGAKTALFDLDPQGHVAYSLGLKKQKALHRFVVGELPISDVVLNARENLDLILSDKKTYKVKRYLSSEGSEGESILDELTSDLPYDVVFFDVAPSLDILQVAALVAADFCIIPTKLDAMAVDGVNEVLTSFANIKKITNSKIAYGVLPTFFERVTRETSAQMTGLIEAYSGNVWEPIPQDTKVRETPSYKKTLWEYDVNTPAITGHKHGDSYIGGYQMALKKLLNEVVL